MKMLNKKVCKKPSKGFHVLNILITENAFIQNPSIDKNFFSNWQYMSCSVENLWICMAASDVTAAVQNGSKLGRSGLSMKNYLDESGCVFWSHSYREI